MTINLLTVNVGSTSVKTRQFGCERDLPNVVAHRIVNGGPDLLEHQPVTPEVLAELKRNVGLAPLHNPRALDEIDRMMRLYPKAQHWVFFDTAFHITIPYYNSIYPVPRSWGEQRRYGFHGLSCSYLARLFEDVPRLIIAHCGGGTSVTAVEDGESVATTMGITPVDGCMGATRSGSVDPRIVLDRIRAGDSPDWVELQLNANSGLLALSGGLTDWRDLRASSSGLACCVYTESVARHIGAMAATMGGADLIVLTGGIGARDKRLLEDIESRCGFIAPIEQRVTDEEQFIYDYLKESLR